MHILDTLCCHLNRESLELCNCSGGLAQVNQAWPISESLLVLCQPDSLALRPAKEEEQGFPTKQKKKGGH